MAQASINKDLIVPCINYHRIHPGAGPEDPRLRAFSMDLAGFCEHMEALCQAGYTTAYLGDFIAWQKGLQPPPAKPIIVTFDDGWASNYHHVWPAMQRMGLAWNIFVVPNAQACVFAEGDELDAALTAEQIRELAAAGVGIQSHGMTHRPFTETPARELREELLTSRKLLTDITGKPVEWLASPYGLSKRWVEKIVQETGYLGYACGLVGASKLSDNPLLLRRIGPPPHWSGQDLLHRLTPEMLRRSTIRGNMQRKLRLVLGHKWSTRVRGLTKGKIAW
jgi:peptidoglycan/xylan/chitin deacetylase (PgdA/CDA1 family)